MGRFLLFMVLAGAGAASAQVGEQVIARCYIGDDEREVVLSQRNEEAFWTESNLRVTAQMIRSVDTDGVLGITVNLRDGTLAMLSLERPAAPPSPRRRAAALTIHQVAGGDITAETYDAHCDVEAGQ